MGFHPVSRVVINREYDPPKIVVRCYDDELHVEDFRVFDVEDVAEAMAWVSQKLNERSM